ncbi:MAG: hypothetical protein ACOCVV_03850 [Marinobacter sp.]
MLDLPRGNGRGVDCIGREQPLKPPVFIHGKAEADLVRQFSKKRDVSDHSEGLKSPEADGNVMGFRASQSVTKTDTY